MKKWAIQFLCVFAFTAQLQGEKVSSLYIAPEWSYLYSDWGNGTSQSGSMWGFAAGYNYTPKDDWYFLAEFNYKAGMLTGSAGNDPTQEYVTELRAGYNLTASLPSKMSVTPFLGFASYVFNQSIAGDNPFNSYFWYVPIGIFFDYKCSPDWKVGFLGMGAPTFGGRWKIVNWDSAPTSALWRGELYANYTSLLPFDLGLIAFVEGWSYKKDGGLIEQKNTYYGLRCSLGYKF